jgi:hypothetical protein
MSFLFMYVFLLIRLAQVVLGPKVKYLHIIIICPYILQGVDQLADAVQVTLGPKVKYLCIKIITYIYIYILVVQMLLCIYQRVFTRSIYVTFEPKVQY